MLPRYIFVIYVIFIIKTSFVWSTEIGKSDGATPTNRSSSVGGPGVAGSSGAARNATGDKRSPGRENFILVVPSRSLVKKNDNGSVAISSPSASIYIWMGIFTYLYVYWISEN